MKKISEAINPSWIGDLQLLLRDCWYFGRDTMMNIIHLVTRAVKLVTLMSIWGKSVSKYTEQKLYLLRSMFK